jgi:hypothetical protein
LNTYTPARNNRSSAVLNAPFRIHEWYSVATATKENLEWKRNGKRYDEE